MDNVLSAVVNTRFVTYKQVRKGSKGKFQCWGLYLLLLSNEPLELSGCANKNTNTLIINVLVSESRVDYSEKIRGNIHRYHFQGLRLCTKAFFHLCTYLNIYQGNREMSTSEHLWPEVDRMHDFLNQQNNQWLLQKGVSQFTAYLFPR